MGLITVSELTNEKPEKLLKKLMGDDEDLSKEIHVRPQTYFIENYDNEITIDLDDPYADGQYRKFDWDKKKKKKGQIVKYNRFNRN